MKPFQGLLRDTWWLWIGFLVVGTLMGVLVDLIFLVIYPISLFSFVYFALVRYDSEGNLKHQDD